MLIYSISVTGLLQNYYLLKIWKLVKRSNISTSTNLGPLYTQARAQWKVSLI